MKKFNAQYGVGLIEVMVTVLILSTSLLGLAALQSRALQYNHSAYMRSQANILAYDLLDRMRASRGRLADYNLGINDAPPMASGNQAQSDLIEWRQALNELLPEGSGGISCDTNNVCTVVIQWAEHDATGSDGNADKSNFQYMTRI
ncbi:type IV pilus modification protein PilV [Microbulbifer sp. DLAB2-AF]|uniref:Type IV pilus modification protein PilV n=1 Tax=Microbulbifer variabilis TaxID=266805 RepID=A0ABY4VCR5_9GAMM|nr:type IV pilus modification protein PilV [Microbulbifer variabilis]USD22091.1 type IV pilus modification protein PilV [Microbulbifer variabilis]